MSIFKPTLKDTSRSNKDTMPPIKTNTVGQEITTKKKHLFCFETLWPKSGKTLKSKPIFCQLTNCPFATQQTKIENKSNNNNKKGSPKIFVV